MKVSMATVHSLNRAKDRLSINGKKADRMINQAIKKGKRASEFSSWERRFLEEESSNGSEAIAYNNYCYIISENGFCITMYPLPAWFGKKKRFDGKEHIRNIKNYARNYFCDYILTDMTEETFC